MYININVPDYIDDTFDLHVTFKILLGMFPPLFYTYFFSMDIIFVVLFITNVICTDYLLKVLHQLHGLLENWNYNCGFDKIDTTH